MTTRILVRHNVALLLLLPLLLVFLCTVSSFQSRIRTHRRTQTAPLDSSSPQSSSSASSYYIATCIPGLSQHLANELQDCQCQDVQTQGSSTVSFQATVEVALQALLWIRTAHKLMELLCVSSSPTITNRNQLAQFVKDNIDLQDLLGNGQGGLLTLSVQTIFNNKAKIPSDINHSHYTALTIKNAVVDGIRSLRGDRPSVDIDNPDVPLVAVLWGTDSGAQVSLYRQLHIGSLHKRGYRQDSTIHKAALKESLAAGLLYQMQWPVRTDNTPVQLVDPMMGSGTLLLEAVCMAASIAPGLMRIKCHVPNSQLPPVVRWKSTPLSLWHNAVRNATTLAQQGLQKLKVSPDKIRFLGNDVHPGAVQLTMESLQRAGLSDLVDIHQGDCASWQVPRDLPNTLVVCNPPWGTRLHDDDDTQAMEASWEALRVFVHSQCQEAWILSGNAQATKHLGLRRSSSMPIQTGQQDLRWLQYFIHDKTSGVDRPSSTRPSTSSTASSATTTKPRKRSSLQRVDKKPETNEWLI